MVKIQMDDFAKLSVATERRNRIEQRIKYIKRIFEKLNGALWIIDE